jgi:hypothetical protein
MSLMYIPNQGFDLERLDKAIEGVPALLDKQFKESQEEVDKAYEEKLAFFDQLDNLRADNPTEYQSSFGSLNAGNKKQYLWHLQSEGELSKEEYKDQVHDAYRQEFQENIKKGIYTGYVPYEVDGKTLFVEARQFDPSVNKTFRGEDDFVRNSILPHDTFYFPEKHQKQPDLTEKDWLVGMADPSGNIQYASGITYNPNTQGGYETTVEGRAKEILEPDTGFIGTVAPLLNLAGAITGNRLLSAAGAIAGGGDIKEIVESIAISTVTPDILETTLADLGVDADLFGLDPETFTRGLGNIQGTILEGGSGKDAVLKEFGGEALEAVGIDLPEFELPETEIIEDIRELGRTVDATLLQPFKEGVETVTAPIEDLSTPLKEAIETVGEPIVDVIDEVIDAVDSPIGDVLETAVGGLGGTGGMMSGARKPSQVEGLFDKELFKFDTEIKSTQRMLSPTNTRRYG